MKSRPVGAEVFHADGQTGMTKVRVAFRNFANAPNQTATSTTQQARHYNAVDLRTEYTSRLYFMASLALVRTKQRAQVKTVNRETSVQLKIAHFLKGVCSSRIIRAHA
jgi:hypothetical protein